MTSPSGTLQGKWREGKSSPYTGKRSARPAGKPGDFLIVIGAFATIPSPPLPSGATIDTILRRLSMRFQGRAESIGPMWFKTKTKVKVKTKSQGGNRPPPAGRPRARAKERVGRTTPFSSSAMSSAPAIP
jgi:hypothetical protein